jgi:hypothetical protein
VQLAALMPVGPNESARHLERCLKAARGWADILICFGDGTDPASQELIGRHAHVARFGPTSLYETGEHLMRNQLLELADQHLHAGDIVVNLDADEEIHQTAARTRETLHSLADDPADSWNVHFLHLWNPEGTHHRVDGLWQPSVGPRVWRFQTGIRLQPLYESAWVCPGLPPHLLHNASPRVLFDILHWSYARPHDRQPKYDRYSRLPGHHPAHIQSIIEEPALEAIPCP